MQSEIEYASRSSRYAGVLSLVACLILLVAFLSARLGLPVLVGVRAVFALYVLNILPGYLALRFVFRVKTSSPFEAMAASLILGALVTPLVWHTLCWLRIDAFFFGFLYALAAAAPIALAWHRHPLARLRALVPAVEAPIVWVTLLLVVLWSYELAVGKVMGERVNIYPYMDHALHATFVAELARGVPMETVPGLVAARKWAYHHVPDVWAEMMRRATGSEPNDAYFYLALPLRYVMLSLGFYLALVRRFGRAGTITGLICAFGVAGWPGGQNVFFNWLAWYVHASYPTAFGLAAVGLIIYCASAIRTQRPRGPLLLASFLSVLLLWHKANFALVVAPAVALFSALTFLRRKEYRWIVVCLGVQGLLTAIRYLDLSMADVYSTFVFDGLNYLPFWWERLVLPVPLAGLRSLVELLPGPLKWSIAYALCALVTFHVGVVAVVYLLGRANAGRTKGGADQGDILTLLILLTCGLGFVLLPITSATAYDVSAHIVFLVQALLFTLLGPPLCGLARWVWHRGRTAAVLTATVGLALAVANVSALRRTALAAPVPAAVISKSLYDAYRYVQTNTPEGAVILVPDYHAPSVAGLVTQRRVVFERATMWTELYDTAPIESDLRSFYGGSDAAVHRAIIDRYGVDYVVADHVLASDLTKDPDFVEVFHRGDTVVLRADRSIVLTSASR